MTLDNQIVKKILIFSPSSEGGIAEHTFYQANALQNCGAQVVCLVSLSFLGGRKTDFQKITCLPNPLVDGFGWTKKLRMAWRIILSRYILAWQIIRQQPDLVLLDSYVEYLAPFWIDPHIILSRLLGVQYAANLHDPVRSYTVGPKWWHRLSVWLAYQPLDFVLMHHELADNSIVPQRVKVVIAPHGLYDVNLREHDPSKIRREWGILPGQRVFLSFGYVRDGKNLDLAIRALREVPEAVLLVTGTVASSKDKNFQDYRNLATKTGVADRCRFFEGFVSDKEMGRYFSGTDFILLTYSADFHSQSGVLNLAARARKPILASASPSPMIDTVKRYRMGVAVEPDSMKAIIEGMKELVICKQDPDWDDYEKVASWDKNAKSILKTIQS